MDIHEFIRNWAVELKDSPEVEAKAAEIYQAALAEVGPRRAKLLLFDWIMIVRGSCMESFQSTPR